MVSEENRITSSKSLRKIDKFSRSQETQATICVFGYTESEPTKSDKMRERFNFRTQLPKFANLTYK